MITFISTQMIDLTKTTIDAKSFAVRKKKNIQQSSIQFQREQT